MDSDPLLSLERASKLAEVSARALRARVQRGTLEAETVEERGQDTYKVRLSALLAAYPGAKERSGTDEPERAGTYQEPAQEAPRGPEPEPEAERVEHDAEPVGEGGQGPGPGVDPTAATEAVGALLVRARSLALEEVSRVQSFAERQEARAERAEERARWGWGVAAAVAALAIGALGLREVGASNRVGDALRQVAGAQERAALAVGETLESERGRQAAQERARTLEAELRDTQAQLERERLRALGRAVAARGLARARRLLGG